MVGQREARWQYIDPQEYSPWGFASTPTCSRPGKRQIELRPAIHLPLLPAVVGNHCVTGRCHRESATGAHAAQWFPIGHFALWLLSRVTAR